MFHVTSHLLWFYVARPRLKPWRRLQPRRHPLAEIIFFESGEFCAQKRFPSFESVFGAQLCCCCARMVQLYQRTIADKHFNFKFLREDNWYSGCRLVVPGFSHFLAILASCRQPKPQHLQPLPLRQVAFSMDHAQNTPESLGKKSYVTVEDHGVSNSCCFCTTVVAPKAKTETPAAEASTFHYSIERTMFWVSHVCTGSISKTGMKKW